MYATVVWFCMFRATGLEFCPEPCTLHRGAGRRSWPRRSASFQPKRSGKCQVVLPLNARVRCRVRPQRQGPRFQNGFQRWDGFGLVGYWHAADCLCWDPGLLKVPGKRPTKDGQKILRVGPNGRLLLPSRRRGQPSKVFNCGRFDSESSHRADEHTACNQPPPPRTLP